MYPGDSKYILALGAHPDDVETGCCGSLSRFKDEGYSIIYLVFSKCLDQPGNQKIVSELLKASKIIGVSKLQLFDFPNMRLPEYNNEIRDILEKIKVKYDPSIVFCPSDDDIHQDHHTVFKESYRVYRNHTLLGFEIPRSSVHFTPDVFIRFSKKYADKKLRIIDCYKSQRKKVYFRKEVILSSMIHRGAFVGVDYAEAFKSLRIII